MKTKIEAYRKMIELKLWFMEEKQKFTNIILTYVDSDDSIKVYYIGNKYILENKHYKHEEVLVMSIKIDQYSKTHSTKSNEYFLDMQLNFRNSSSSEDWLLPKDIFQKQVHISLIKSNRLIFEK